MELSLLLPDDVAFRVSNSMKYFRDLELLETQAPEVSTDVAAENKDYLVLKGRVRL
jgi:hypothetical protein